MDKARFSARILIAIAGPPAAGKSTMADHLRAVLPEREAIAVPMDGFHLDNRVLAARILSTRKGAPETFDFRGFEVLLTRLKNCENDVAIPLFDRSLELSRAGAAIVSSSHRFVIVEGNYLLLNEDPWRRLKQLFDFTVFIEAPESELDRRLAARWQAYGRERSAARRWINNNDLPNARRVLQNRLSSDMTMGGELSEPGTQRETADQSTQTSR